jgi:hypothetical protein
MYDRRLYIPSEEEWKKAMDDYSADVGTRMKEDKLKPGETVFEGDDGKLKPKGNVAFMEVNARLARMLFDRNPKHDFYIEESMPMDWTYPHLSPHGLILKLNRQPLTGLDEKALQENRRYWERQTGRLLGGWLTNETPVKVLCQFVEDVYGQAQLEGFTGDPDYVLASKGRNVNYLYAHLRMAQAHVYEWRLSHASTPEEKARMIRELDLAYRQTIALSPTNAETVRRYVNLLRDQNRPDDARRMLKAGQMINPRSKRLQALEEEMKEN